MLCESFETSHISAISGPSQWKRHLLPLVLVTPFFKAATDMIWEHMHCLLPVFSLLPSFKAEATGYSFGGITDDEWSSGFYLYTEKVKQFTFTSPCVFEEISQSWLSFLLIESLKRPFFPSLKSFTLLHGAQSALKILPMTIHPAFQSLDMQLRSIMNTTAVPKDWETEGEGDSGIDPFVSSVASLTSQLKKLRYRGPLTDSSLISISRLKKLHSLSLTPTTPCTYNELPRKLKNLTELRDLTIAVHRPQSDPPTCPNYKYPSGGHLRLTSISLTGKAWSICCLVSQLSPTTLVRFRACVTDIGNGGPLKKQLAIVLSRNKALQHLTVSSFQPLVARTRNCTYSSLPDSPEFDLLTKLPSSIRSGLQEVDITGIPIFSTSDIRLAVTRCLQHYPDASLIKFRFHIPKPLRKDEDEAFLPTWDTLSFIALEGSKTLRHLELQLQTACFQQPPTIPPGFSDHGLQHLFIVTDDPSLNLSFHDKIAIAVFIDHLFPHLQSVGGTAEEEWGMINALVLSYQERRLAALERYRQESQGKEQR
ncbi:hypothetical protein CC2G_014730 [Coprinopsis cinerea AmutBmut pab1-1]|nr:hypothetical protein CC2G_014730 [Coprinopsis cinerea AmutBmut pab1-1]